MATKKKEPQEAPSLDSVRSFLYEVENHYTIPSNSYREDKEGLAFRARQKELKSLEFKRNKRLKELEATDKLIKEIDSETAQIESGIKAESKEVLARVSKFKRALNVRGLKPEVLAELEAFEQDLAKKD
jgi:hypothetical protein